MNETDAFFTHAIVGPPQSVILGRRLTADAARKDGLHIDLASGHNQLSTLWSEWVVLSHATDDTGKPRMRPGRLRGMLERHALLIALAGLLALATAGTLLGMQLWT